MATEDIPIPPSRDLPPRVDTLCFLCSLSIMAGANKAAEGYLLELMAQLTPGFS